MKKEWKKPVMTIVAKSTAEENVLYVCKTSPDMFANGGPGYPDICVTHWNPDGTGCSGTYNS